MFREGSRPPTRQLPKNLYDIPEDMCVVSISILIRVPEKAGDRAARRALGGRWKKPLHHVT
jgi:hypothetical protein